MGGTYGDQFAGVPALCQLGIECGPVNLALVEFDIFVGQGDNLVVGHATSFVELSVSHYSLIGDPSLTRRCKAPSRRVSPSAVSSSVPSHHARATMRERAETNLDPHPPRRGQTPKASAIASRSNAHEQRIKQTTNKQRARC